MNELELLSHALATWTRRFNPLHTFRCFLIFVSQDAFSLPRRCRDFARRSRLANPNRRRILVPVWLCSPPLHSHLGRPAGGIHRRLSAAASVERETMCSRLTPARP